MAADAAAMIGSTCWDGMAKYWKCIRSLEENLKRLRESLDELVRVYDDVNRLVRTAEGKGWARTSDVGGWLNKVGTLKKEADKILEDGEKIVERDCLCGLCCWNFHPRYKQSCRAEAKLAPLKDELTLGRTFKVEKDVAYELDDVILKRSLDALRDKTGALRLKMDELRDFFETVKQRVEREEKEHLVRTPEVRGWLERVEDLLEKQALEVLKEGKLELEKSHQIVEGDSQVARNSSYIRISNCIDEKTAILEGMLSQGHNFVIFTVECDEDPPILEIPSDNPVGAESMFKEVWDWVEDETVRSIGLFGMGGVGKTTLLKRVHNQFLKVRLDYYFVLWVVVSRPLNLDKIQADILRKLKLPECEWDKIDRTGRAALILSVMEENNVILFLDDLWDSIDLLEDVGIPCRTHSKKCKIIFSTQDEGVCDRMQPDKKKKVECLPPSDALQLFRQKLGEETWGAHLGIPEIAASMVQECKYLPIALVTIARVMAGTTKLNDWMAAENDLRSRVSKFPDMKERVLANLEFSYANLPDETHRKCFLYLSIFPEDHEILEEDAINLWIGEGFLDDCSDDHEAHRNGEKYLKNLGLRVWWSSHGVSY